MQTRLVLLWTSLLFTGIALPAIAEEPPAAEGSVWMQKKLLYSREILAGIATGDFDQIARNAELMNGLSRVEGFVRSRTPTYRTQLARFQEANEELLREAKRDNLDGATLAFHQLVSSCVKCHRQLREQAKAKE